MGNCLEYCSNTKNEKYTELTSSFNKYNDFAASYDFKTKMILLGDTNVGKTSILKVLSNKQYHLETTPTIGVDFDMIQFNDEDDITYKVCVWDTAGNPQYKLATQLYYKDSRIFCLIYDVTDRKTFIEINNILDDIKNHNIHRQKFCILIANKINLHEKRVVSSLEGNSFAREKGFYYCEMNDNATQTLQTIKGFLTIICREIYSEEIKNLKKQLDKNVKTHLLSKKHNANIIHNPNNKRQNNNSCMDFFGLNNNSILTGNARISSIENGVSYEPL